MDNKNTIKVLWLAPNLNHYKSRLLNHLADDSVIDLCVFSGSGNVNESLGDCNFRQIKVDVPKKDFGKSSLVKKKFKTVFNEFDWIMIPVEKKNIALFLYAVKLRKQNKNVRLFSYNHPVLRSGNGKITQLDKWITKFYYKKLDRVVFYTEQSCQWAIKNRFISQNKAYWANNTIDNTEIEKHYTFQLPPEHANVVVYIGQLTARKRIPELIKYYSELKKRIPNLILEIIGDGPESHVIESAMQSDTSINWHGTLIDEAEIAPIMKKAALVFIPGHSGLSVNHAFLYGRPHVTLEGPSHAPELDYLDIGENGYVMDDNFQSNSNTIASLLNDRSVLERFCISAMQKGACLSVQKWVEQIKQSLVND